MRKLLVCATLLCVAVSIAHGQESGEAKTKLPPSVRLGDVSAEAARLLKSEDNKERAWGAYLVGLHGLKEHTPRLVSTLEDERLRSGGWHERVVLQAALDALIRLDAEVPAESILPLYASAPDEVLILLSREPEKNGLALLQLFNDDIPDARWLALGNLLSAEGASGFAARLLGGLKIEASVYVYDRKGKREYGVGGNGGHGCGAGGDVDESLPPVSYYHLTTEALRGSVVFASGRRNVYYARTPWDTYCGDGWRHLERDSARVEYLADMLGTSDEDLGLDARPFREVGCKDSRQCARSLSAVRDEIGGAYASALKRLLERGLLDAAEAAELKPDLTLKLMDKREKKSFALPDRLKGVKIEVAMDFDIEPETSTDDATPQPNADGPPVIPSR